jgi:hypothetical protein
MGQQPQNPMSGLGQQPMTLPYQPGGFGGSMGGQLTPLPSPNMPQPYMPGIDSYGGQPQVGGPAQMVGTDDAFFQSPEFKEYQNDPRNMMATQDMYNSPYFGQMGSGSAGRAQDAAYRKYKGLADPNQLYGQIPQNPMPQPGGSGNNNQLGQLGNRFGQLGNMANIPQSEIGMPGGQGGQTQGGMGQQLLQQARAMQQQGGMGQQPMGLAGLLGGMPNQPTPTAPPVPTTQPAPMAQPAPVAARPAPMAQPAPAPTRAAPAKPSIMGSRPAAKPVAKPSVVPPKTPPAVARAIQKLAAKKQNRR